MATEEGEYNLPQDGVVLRNLKGAMYKMALKDLGGNARVTCMTSQGNLVFVGVANRGLRVFRVEGSQVIQVCEVASSESGNAGVTCYQLSASASRVVYIRDDGSRCALCVHQLEALLQGNQEPQRTLAINRRAPMVVDYNLGLIIIGCSAWSVSWTSGGKHAPEDKPEADESHLRVLDLASCAALRQWKVTENAVSLLRRQTTATHSMLGVADTRAGLKVFDLRQPTPSDSSAAYACLYHVPVEEIRNFHLVGNYVAVFHKFEPNVTFWNMLEQKTILCINIQDQMRELAEEFLEDEEEEDAGLFGEDDDHVTSVTCARSDDDHVLMYGTKSGCIFGMSVNSRTKLFNIPCPHEVLAAGPETAAGASRRRDIQGLRYIAKGKLVVSYEKYGLTLLDFSPENPPDRPPTRCQRREVTST